MFTAFDNAQQATERVFAEYDRLRSQGKTRTEAIDHVTHRHGLVRHKLVALLNDRDAAAGAFAPVEVV